MCPGALWPACTEVLRCRKRLMITDFTLLRRQETDRKSGTMDKTFRGISATREKVANEFTPQSTRWRNCVYTPENAVRMFMDAASQDKKQPCCPWAGIWAICLSTYPHKRLGPNPAHRVLLVSQTVTLYFVHSSTVYLVNNTIIE